MKPIAAGFDAAAGEWRNEDVERLLAASNVAVTRAEINPVALKAAIAPHIAAEQEGTVIALTNIREAFAALSRKADVVVVEGVGGFKVPLGPNLDTTDLARELGLPVILVVGLRLGCLNHALLSADAIRAQGLHLAGWVANRVDPAMLVVPENIATLDERLGCARLGLVPHLGPAEVADTNRIAELLNVETLLKGISS
jgi:dethiobiotin synthetase